MKKCFVYLFMAVLCFLSCYGLFACRSFKKSKSSADSTITRNVEQKQTWQAETIEEMVIETDDLSFVQPGLPLPSIQSIARQRPVGILERLGLVKHDRNQVETKPPGKKKAATRVILRKVTRQSSQQSSQLREEKDVSTAHLDKSREPNAVGLLTISLFSIVVIVIIIILLKSKHPD